MSLNWGKLWSTHELGICKFPGSRYILHPVSLLPLAVNSFTHTLSLQQVGVFVFVFGGMSVLGCVYVCMFQDLSCPGKLYVKLHFESLGIGQNICYAANFFPLFFFIQLHSNILIGSELWIKN